MAAGWIGDRWYNTVWREKPRGWHVVWVRCGRDKPKTSLWAKPGERESRQAIFKELEHAETYIELATTGKNTGRFEIHD